MRFYPVFLNLENRMVVIVGGGPVAERKTLPLMESGANTVIISPALTEKLKEWVNARQIHHLSRVYQKGDLKGASLVIAATSSSETNLKIAEEAKALSIFVNNVNAPDTSTFIVPSVITKKDLQIAVSTGGQSPALAKQIRQKLEEQFGPEYDLFIGLLSKVRKELHKNAVTAETRAEILNKLAESDILDLIKQDQKEKALERVKEISRLNLIKF